LKDRFEFHPAIVKSYRLLGYENRRLIDEDFNDDKKDAGELGSGHTVTALYELIPTQKEFFLSKTDEIETDSNQAVESLKNQKTGFDGEWMTIKFRYKKPKGMKSILMVHTLNGKAKPIESASENLKFSSAVALFGMLLRDSKWKGNASLEEVEKPAKEVKGGDEVGYRAEFLQLVSLAGALRPK
jgi:Ca-activated chloride channel family protein